MVGREPTVAGGAARSRGTPPGHGFRLVDDRAGGLEVTLEPGRTEDLGTIGMRAEAFGRCGNRLSRTP